jgi:hypothetical protein
MNSADCCKDRRGYIQEAALSFFGDDIGAFSDGYHTFDELYEFRKVYNALLFNEWSKKEEYKVHKSKRHSDGEECFGGGWFVVVAELPTGQITNHYKNKDWDLFQIPEHDKALIPYDGHTPQDALKRMKNFCLQQST